MSMRNLKYKKYNYIAISILTIIFMTIMLKTTSPFFETIGWDSAIFLTVGKSIANGNILYTDIFDHKGPILFFFNAIPQVFIEGTLGVWILQTLFMVISVILILKICDMLEIGSIKYVIPFIYIIFSWITFEGGNYSEEYSNLFCVISLYIFIKYYINKFKYRKSYPLILGICFMAVALIRVNNAAIIVSIILSVLMMLIYRKEFKTLLSCTLSFLWGGLIVIVPISIYFIFNNAFYDFIYGTFLYNFKYKNGGVIENISKVFDYGLEFTFIILIIIFMSIINIIILSIKSKYELIILVAINLLVIIIAIASGGKGYIHYLAIGIVPIILNLVLAFKYWNILRLKFVKVTGAILTVFILGIFTIFQLKVLEQENSWLKDYKKDAEYLASYVMKDEDMLGYNIPARWYYMSGLLPDYKYFILQDWWSSFDSDIRKDINRYLDEDAPDWMVVADINSIENEYVKEFIKNNYILTDSNSSGYIYKLVK